MRKKVFVQVTMRLEIDVDEGVDIGAALCNGDCNFTLHTTGADIVDIQLVQTDILDSK